MLRIIAGKYKGSKLHLPPESITRPSSGRLRQAVFNILSARINWQGIKVCDAFAGSGAMGLEALSRGAASVLFCEKSPETFNILRKNIEYVFKGDLSAVDLHKDFFNIPQTEFDLIFLDPPYQSGMAEESLNFISNKTLLKPGGIVVLEEPKGFSTEADNFEIVERRSYGNCQISFYLNASNLTI